MHNLLKLGANPNFKMAKYNSTPLQWATYCGIKNAPKLNYQLNAAVIEALLIGGATYDIMSAVANQDLQQVKWMLKKNPEEVNSKWMNGFSPLHVNNSFEIGKLLIRKGADMNAQNKAGRTALHGAVRRGHEEIVHALLKSGAKKGLKNKKGETPLDKAKNLRKKPLKAIL